MNSDPTGNFTLVGLSISTILQRTLKGAANGAVLGGFFSMIDALLDGERDPLQAFADGAKSGLVVGAVFGNFTAFAKLSTSKIVAVTAKLAMGSLLSVGGVGGIVGAVDSFKKGNYVQGAYRAAFSYLCFRGAYRQFGGAYNTATNNSNSFKNTSSNNSYSNNKKSPIVKETKASQKIGKSFDPNGPKSQEGIDPNSLAPSKNLDLLNKARMDSAIKYAGDKPIIVDRNGSVLDGHHRLKYAIEHNKAVDISVGYN